MGLFDFLRVPRAISVGGAMVRTAEAAAALIPPADLYDAFLTAMGHALGELTKRTKAGEHQASIHLETALACAARMEALQGKEAGPAFRVNMRPRMVAMLYHAEEQFGAFIRNGEAPPREVFELVLRRAE